MERERRISKAIPELDAEIRTIEPPREKPETKGDTYWRVEYGIYESTGEQAGDIVTELYDSEPTEAEIKKDIRNQLKENWGELKDRELLTGREEMQLAALKRLRNRGAI